MSRHGEITLSWGDGEYKFRMAYGELRKLQESCDVGPPLMVRRLLPYHPETNPLGDNWRVEYIRETIRIALIGGGQTQADALALVQKFVDQRPLLENRELAFGLIQMGLAGAPDEPLGKAEGEPTKAKSSPTKRSPSPASSELPA